MKPRFTPERAREFMRELQAHIGDEDTAALVLIRVQAGRGTNRDACAEAIHVVDAEADPRALAEIVLAAAHEFRNRMARGSLGTPTQKCDA